MTELFTRKQQAAIIAGMAIVAVGGFAASELLRAVTIIAYGVYKSIAG